MNLFETVNKEMSSIRAQFQALSLAPVTRGFNKNRYGLDIEALHTLVLKFSKNELAILKEMDCQFIEDEPKFIRLVSQWQNKLQESLDFMFSIFGKSSLPEELKYNELKFWRAYMQVIAKKDAEINKQNVSLTFQDNAVLFAYFLNKILVSIINKKIELLPTIRKYYAVELGTIVSSTFINDEAGRKAYAKEIQIAADQSFKYQLAIKAPERIPEYLDFHLRSYIRNGGIQAEWIRHTKEIAPAGFTPEQKDSFFTWIERHDQSFEQWFEKGYNLGIFKEVFRGRGQMGQMDQSNLRSMLNFEFSNLGNFSKPITKDTLNEFYNYLKDNEQAIIDRQELDRQEMTKPLVTAKQGPQKDNLKVNQIALIHVYEGKQITRENATAIAKKNGYNAKSSGEGLFQDFTKYCSSSNRKGRPTPCTPKKLQNKIELFQSILKHLSKGAKERAKDEIKILKTIFENEYQ